MFLCSEFCLSSFIGSVLIHGLMRLLIVNRLNSTKSPEVDLGIYQDKVKSMSASVGDLTIEFELDG